MAFARITFGTWTETWLVPLRAFPINATQTRQGPLTSISITWN